MWCRTCRRWRTKSSLRRPGPAAAALAAGGGAGLVNRRWISLISVVWRCRRSPAAAAIGGHRPGHTARKATAKATAGAAATVTGDSTSGIPIFRMGLLLALPDRIGRSAAARVARRERDVGRQLDVSSTSLWRHLFLARARGRSIQLGVDLRLES